MNEFSYIKIVWW